MSMKVFFEKHKIPLIKLGILIFNALVLVFVALVIGIRFQTNDDSIMCMIANGVLTGTPNGHLVFINTILGSLIAGLYSINSNIEWYTYMMLAFHLGSMSTIVWCIISDYKTNKYIKIALTISIYAIWFYCLHLLQFTSVAAFVAFAACLLLLHRSTKATIIGCLMMLCASWIRFKMAGFITILFAPAIILAYKKEWRRYLILVILGIVVLTIHYCTNLKPTPAEQHYAEYNALRGRINDNPNNIAIYDINFNEEITTNDIDLFLWFVGDPSVWNISILKEVQKYLSSSSLSDRLKHYYFGYHRNILYYFLLLWTLSLFIISVRRGTAGLLYFFFYILLLFTISINFHMKDRVFIPSLLPVMYVFTSLAKDCQVNSSTKYRIYITLSIIPFLYFTYRYSKQSYRMIVSSNRATETFNKCQIPLLSKIGTNKLYSFGCDLSYEYISPFNLHKISWTIIPCGWLTHYPYGGKELNSYLDLISDDVYLFLSKGNIKLLNKMVNSIEQHHNLTVYPCTVCDNNRYMLVYLQKQESNDTIQQTLPHRQRD